MMEKSIYDKRYISEEQALKAARKAGCTEVIKDGKMWRAKTPAELNQDAEAVVEAAVQSKRQIDEAWIREFQGKIDDARNDVQIQNLYEELNRQQGLAESVVAALDERIGVQAEEIEATQAITGKPVTKDDTWVHSSSVLKPTKLVWVIADEMYAEAQNAGKPMPSRKEVQAECVRRGIASGTARTQFQHWFKCHNENPERATIDPVTGKIIPPSK